MMNSTGVVLLLAASLIAAPVRAQTNVGHALGVPGNGFTEEWDNYDPHLSEGQPVNSLQLMGALNDLQSLVPALCLEYEYDPVAKSFKLKDKDSNGWVDVCVAPDLKMDAATSTDGSKIFFKSSYLVTTPTTVIEHIAVHELGHVGFIHANPALWAWAQDEAACELMFPNDQAAADACKKEKLNAGECAHAVASIKAAASICEALKPTCGDVPEDPPCKPALSPEEVEDKKDAYEKQRGDCLDLMDPAPAEPPVDLPPDEDGEVNSGSPGGGLKGACATALANPPSGIPMPMPMCPGACPYCGG